MTVIECKMSYFYQPELRRRERPAHLCAGRHLPRSDSAGSGIPGAPRTRTCLEIREVVRCG